MRFFLSILALLFAVALPLVALEAGEDNPDNVPGKTSYYLTEDKGIELQSAELVKPELPVHMREFVERYEQVRWEQDEKLLAELIHPASKACEDDTNTDYFNHLRLFYLTEELDKQYRLKIIPVAEDKRWPLKQRLGMPLAPTHVMYMEYSVPGGEIEGLQRYLREETYPELRIYELVKCPDKETLRQFREAQAKAAQSTMENETEATDESSKP